MEEWDDLVRQYVNQTHFSPVSKLLKDVEQPLRLLSLQCWSSPDYSIEFCDDGFNIPAPVIYRKVSDDAVAIIQERKALRHTVFAILSNISVGNNGHAELICIASDGGLNLDVQVSKPNLLTDRFGARYLNNNWRYS